ncbi:hypothetical protein GCM10011575_01520 [Microlunatus endophyticus]|uniref:Uncharacterized protein n=1 Tax=Microlunatus endophyticus TaxID=1716077 RepID=A0A917S114_9ACTN|nr:hypothetical protein [Microlunatus endophyticus]GGL47419.1 hypothetical protein GCM10011575_01520 [Microlunatus endophyticus]
MANRTASFMRSCPNNIPLSPGLVRQIVHASAERYIGWLTDTIRDPDERYVGSTL